MRRNNDELLANWGNLVNRTLVNAHRNFGAVPEPGPLTEGDRALLDGVDAAFDEVGEHIESARFRAALAECMRASSLANQYVAEQAPWALVKTDRERAATVLYVALRCVDSLKTLFAPFLPFTLADRARAARLRGLARRPARVPHSRGGRRLDPRGAHRRLRELGRPWAPSELAAGPDAARAAAALPQAPAARRRGRARAELGL